MTENVHDEAPTSVPALSSLWLSTGSHDRYPTLAEDVEVDVAVIGGGITGMSVAHLLKTEGRTVALVELGRIGQGTTGRTTAKLTVGQSLIYARLRAAHGLEAARLYAESNSSALVEMADLIERLGIGCDWEPTSNYVYSESSASLPELQDELDAVRAAGIEAELTRETDLPFPVAGAIRIDGQAQLHPIKFLHALAVALPGDGSHVFEETRAVGVRSGETCVVETSGGRVRAGHVVVATQLPFLDRGFFFAKAHAQKSYAISARADSRGTPLGMYISIDDPIRSIRSAPADAGGRYLIVGGEGQRPGEGSRTSERYGSLERFMQERFGIEADLRWSAHDYMPSDGLPYIGRLRRHDDRIYTATGFAKWGLTKATIAARIIADAIARRPNRWAELYSASRLTPRASAMALVTANTRVAAHFLVDRLRPRPGLESVSSLEAGQGAILRAGGRHYAVYRDDAGTAHVFSARCPHLGCLVEWSEGDRTWECPCHGSRFTADGKLVQGPATEDLRRRDLPTSPRGWT